MTPHAEAVRASNSRPVWRSNPLHSFHSMRLENAAGSSWANAFYASYCKLWLNLGHGSLAERKMAMLIGRPLLKLNASTRGPRS